MQRLFPRALALILLGLLGLPSAVQAQDVDFDEESEASTPAARRKAQREVYEGVVREIERGVYLKSSAGGVFLLGPRSAIMQTGTNVNVTLGMDVIDKPTISFAWELTFYNAIHNSKFQRAEEPPPTGVAGFEPGLLIQGDSNVFSALAGIEFSGYPVRRLGIGLRAGGGVAFIPLLLPRTYYEEVVIPQWGGALGVPDQNAVPAVHEGPLGQIYGGPTIEYYTKLSHFSLGIDVDFVYILGFDFGLATAAYLKYTF